MSPNGNSSFNPTRRSGRTLPITADEKARFVVRFVGLPDTALMRRMIATAASTVTYAAPMRAFFSLRNLSARLLSPWGIMSTRRCEESPKRKPVRGFPISVPIAAPIATCVVSVIKTGLSISLFGKK